MMAGSRAREERVERGAVRDRWTGSERGPGDLLAVRRGDGPHRRGRPHL